jgi:hypothetical protein
MCPCKLRFILFKHKNFVFFFVFLVHNTWRMMHVV